MRRCLVASIIVAGGLAVSGTGASAQSPASIFFDFKSTEMSPLAVSIVQRYASGVRAGSKITVVGHADAAENSRPLSLARARAVQAVLQQSGLPSGVRLSVSGVGYDGNLVRTRAGVKEPQNRYVAVYRSSE